MQDTDAATSVPPSSIISRPLGSSKTLVSESGSSATRRMGRGLLGRGCLCRGLGACFIERRKHCDGEDGMGMGVGVILTGTSNSLLVRSVFLMSSFADLSDLVFYSPVS